MNTTSRGTLCRARLSFTYCLSSAASCLRTRLGNDEGAQPFSELDVVDADYGHLGDVGPFLEQVLDFLREDVLTAGHDHVVVAAVDEQQAVSLKWPMSPLDM